MKKLLIVIPFLFGCNKPHPEVQRLQHEKDSIHKEVLKIEREVKLLESKR